MFLGTRKGHKRLPFPVRFSVDRQTPAMNLDLVLGMSCHNIGSLSCDQNSSLVAHTASGVLVLLDTQTNCQTKYFHLRKNCVSSVNFSVDGRFVVTGETGYRPAVRVWRLKDGMEVSTLYGHEFGIKCAHFSPSMTEIVSVGLEHDNVVNVWAWPAGWIIKVNKIVDMIKAVAYSECGSFFVTAGVRHIKFWYPKLSVNQQGKGLKYAAATVPTEPEPLYGRLAILSECKDHTFIDVACGNGLSNPSVFAITQTGGLVMLSSSHRHLIGNKCIDGVKGTCVKAHDRILFIGFNNGDIHLFDGTTLTHLGALPLPTFFRQTGLSGGGVSTLTFNASTSCLTTAYKNCSMCVWDLHDVGNVKQKYVAVYHSAAIACIDMFTSLPGSSDTQDAATNPAISATRENLVTVGFDSTVRFWSLQFNEAVVYDRLQIFYADEGAAKVVDKTKPKSKILDNSGAITTVKVSTNKLYIVTGNKEGSVCVYDRGSYALRCKVRAHHREVTCLDYYWDQNTGHEIAVSGSRDRNIQVMDVSSELTISSTLNVHSSSITAVKTGLVDGRLVILGAASDRCISLSAGQVVPNCLSHFELIRMVALKSSPNDLVVDHNSMHLAAACQDGNIRVVQVPNLQEKRTFPGCTATEAQINKIAIDKEGALLLSAASDKTINIFNFHSGKILYTVTGHYKNVTGLAFSPKGEHVISTSIDGCVFIWRLTPRLIARRQDIATGGKAVALSSHATSSVLEFSQDTKKAVGPLSFHSPKRQTSAAEVELRTSRPRIKSATFQGIGAGRNPSPTKLRKTRPKSLAGSRVEGPNTQSNTLQTKEQTQSAPSLVLAENLQLTQQGGFGNIEQMMIQHNMGGALAQSDSQAEGEDEMEGASHKTQSLFMFKENKPPRPSSPAKPKAKGKDSKSFSWRNTVGKNRTDDLQKSKLMKMNSF